MHEFLQHFSIFNEGVCADGRQHAIYLRSMHLCIMDERIGHSSKKTTDASNIIARLICSSTTNYLAWEVAKAWRRCVDKTSTQFQFNSISYLVVCPLDTFVTRLYGNGIGILTAVRSHVSRVLAFRFYFFGHLILYRARTQTQAFSIHSMFRCVSVYVCGD